MPETRILNCKCKHSCPTYARVSEWSCGCVDVKIFKDKLAGWDCSDFSGMREHCGREGRPPHRSENRSESRERRPPRRERSYSPSRTYSSGRGSPPPTMGEVTITTAVMAAIGYVIFCWLAQVNAGSLCQMGGYNDFSCARAQLPLGAYLTSGGNPMPPGWHEVNGQPRRLPSYEPERDYHGP